ncbi:pro-sigmaK processing inhibitor BofA family protein [Bacillus sp. TH22]|uniref:pro-sigmaK processing inhibitor BofA family protein n=1 Tax=unclassified Bacillus (in: firmicutes) TaxID=185979 RepID=UPI0019137294|nr:MULTISPECIES: pro-sigmaK processing inhibitor BofA family protein [unclassified Bacillus (in: firmicutes)]MBK5360148.1 pro-sigmaK processing inhibitor BofA family protein [Bacillus sp. TH44]MBK5348129.1 pro-sigmaK processing inhibitor BofA family protein [Bacillus sp. TH45]MBK5364972.1 pro-sigmaK processing inhibitor BofA family protein [Bacillus sp. TH50]MBK5449937.1 pro-sigmaK processing inhibitor BofA family protein [Bacillus sp. TH22]MBK5456316.1 pro-sigmaK processing inhibitor BofA fam
MNSTIIIVGILSLVFIFLVFGVSVKPIRFIGKALFHVTLGIALLFIVNVAGTYFDFHIPINMGTATVSSLLGMPGVAALVIIKLYIMPR